MPPPISQQVSRKPAASTMMALLWALGRVGLLLVVAYVLRRPLLDSIEAVFDIIGITEFAIDRIGTPLSRLVLAVSAGTGFLILAKVCGGLFSRHAYGLSVALAALLTAAFTWLAGGGPLVVGVVTLLLATNWARLAGLKRVGIDSRALDRVIAIPPGVAELFLTSRYLGWLRSLLRREAAVRAEAPPMLPGALIAALALALLTPGKKLVRVEQAMRSGPDVRVLTFGNFNDIAFDAANKRLLATGHGVPRVLAFDVADFSAPALKADVKTGAAQAFEFAPANDELYIHNAETQEILVLQASTLTLKRRIAAPGISPGDPWIRYCPNSETLTIASEADEQTGDPFVVFDRASGAVLDKLDLEAGNLLVHPEKPILYANFFRRVCGVVAYDLKARQVLARADTSIRTDRMAYDPLRRELLMASPNESVVQCFDALTLEPKGEFKTILGSRVITVDEANDAMLVGSLLTGRVALVGLSDRKVRRVWYLGPWLRSIVISPGTGIAYVSSQKSLYELHYTHGK